MRLRTGREASAETVIVIEDFGKYQHRSTIETEIAIIGAGAAGITLARELIDSGIDCCLLESGGEELDSRIQSLYETEVIGHGDQRPCRLRFLGGATNHWGGWCAPLNVIDFGERAWVPNSGWPVSRAALQPYYALAQPICGLGAYAYDVKQIVDDPPAFGVFLPRKLKLRVYQFSEPPLRFGIEYRRDLAQARNIRLLLNANVVKLVANDSASRIDSAMIQTPAGGHGSITARYFVVACGAIENARLLLVSNDVMTVGLGNQKDLVGRYFMQHPHVDCAELVAAVPDNIARLFNRFEAGGRPMRCSLGPSEQAQHERAILNCSATLHGVNDPLSGYGAARLLWHDIRRGRWPDDFASKVWAVVSDLSSVAGEAQTWTLRMRSEQAPDPNSRVSLSEARDSLGMPKARIDWRLSELDKRTVRLGAELIAEEFGRLNWGRMRLTDWLLDDKAGFPTSVWGGCHHMGTTRMGDSPAQGVVDRDCRVHNIANLYIAGSSVFPTSGYANPTLSIVALSLRLGEHLKQVSRTG